jgi:hypothetical protein
MDRLLLNSTQWNYTVSNRNDPSCGDGWNQEDLSVYSVDQDGGRAVEGFVRPYVRATQGVLRDMTFDRQTGGFSFRFDADPAINAPTELYIPAVHYGSGVQIDAPGLTIQKTKDPQVIQFSAPAVRTYTVTIKRA